MTARKGHGAGGRGKLAKAAITAAVALFSIAGASSASADEAMIEGCLKAAAEVHHVPAGVLALLIRVEAGRLGAVSQNVNGTVDIGPMQVNNTWLGEIADHWRTSREAAYRALRDNFCANVESGAWILHQALDEARGRLWEGVALYHSHTPARQLEYMKLVYDQAMRVKREAMRELASADAAGGR